MNETTIVEQKQLAGPLQLVKEIEAIKVTTLDARVAKQLVRRALRLDDTMEGWELLGRLENESLIVVRENGKLYTIHEVDYQANRTHVTGELRRGYQEMQLMPQLFTH